MATCFLAAEDCMSKYSRRKEMASSNVFIGGRENDRIIFLGWFAKGAQIFFLQRGFITKRSNIQLEDKKGQDEISC